MVEKTSISRQNNPGIPLGVDISGLIEQLYEKLCEIREAIQTPVGIETDVFEACVPDPDNECNTLGKVIGKIVWDEETQALTLQYCAIMNDGSVVNPYTGPVIPCPATPAATHLEIVEGPLCGFPVLSKNGKCVVPSCDPATGNIIYSEIDMALNRVGVPAAEDKTTFCLVETLSQTVCADAGVDVTLAPADIYALIVGEAMNDDNATPVDLTVDGIDLIHANVQGEFCPAVIKKPDGSTFTTTSAASCVINANGQRDNLFQGGDADIGSGDLGGAQAAVIDESVLIPAGSAATLCFKVKACFNSDGTVAASRIGNAAAGTAAASGVKR